MVLGNHCKFQWFWSNHCKFSMVFEETITIECFLVVWPLPPMVFQWFLILLPSLSMVFDGFGPLVKRCDGFDGSLWSNYEWTPMTPNPHIHSSSGREPVNIPRLVTSDRTSLCHGGPLLNPLWVLSACYVVKLSHGCSTAVHMQTVAVISCLLVYSNPHQSPCLPSEAPLSLHLIALSISG